MTDFYVGFTIGFLLAAAGSYIIYEVLNAFEKPSADHEKLARCTIEALKHDAELRVADIPDEELIRAVSAGLKVVARGDDESRRVHPKVRD